jgi:hypothetical protein
VPRSGLLAVVVLCVLLAALPARAPAAAPTLPPAHAPAAALDLHWLIGDENEPDEDETDEGNRTRGHDTASWPRGLAIGVTGLAVSLAVALGVVVVRWVRRFVAWKRRVAVRAQALTRRLADELDRAWRR